MTVRAAQNFPHFGMKDVEVVGVDKRKVRVRDAESGREWSVAWDGIKGIR